VSDSLNLVRDGSDAIPIHVIGPDDLPVCLEGLNAAQQTWVATQGFTGKLGARCIVPDATGNMAAVLFGWGTAEERARGRLHLAALARFKLVARELPL